MKIYIVGAGAVGTWLGDQLTTAGCEVIFAPRQLADVVPVDVELVIVAVKAFDTSGALLTLQRALAHRAGTAILCVQNGIGNEECYAEVFGKDCIIAGALTVPIERLADGRVVAANRGGLGLAPLGCEPHNWVIALFDRTSLTVTVGTDARAMKWSKLSLNILANASCAILDMSPAELVRHPQLFALEMECLRELKTLLVQMRITPIDLPRYPVRALLSIAQWPYWLSSLFVAPRLARARGEKLPSLLFDLRSGRQTSEVAALNGAIDREAQRQSGSAPVNRAFTLILEALSATPTLWERYRGQPDAFLGEINRLRSL